MKKPVLVNISIPYRDKEGKAREDIVAAVCDFDWRRIAAMSRTVDGMTYFEYYDQNVSNVKIMVPFEEAIGLYEEQNQVIDDRYKEEVISYSKDNYSGILENYWNKDEK